MIVSNVYAGELEVRPLSAPLHRLGSGLQGRKPAALQYGLSRSSGA